VLGRGASPLNHRVEGSGPAVVLLHAGVADLRMWDGPAAALARRHTVVRCDLRGFGGSDLAPGASYSDPEDVLALLDALGVDRFALVGASYGGWVALQVAGAAPERVAGLVMIAPPAELVEPDPRLRERWAEEGRLVDAGDLDGAADLAALSWLGPDADDDARDLVRVMQRRAYELQVPAGDVENRELPVDPAGLSVPARILVGAHDLPFFAETARELARLMPRAELVELPWAGHLPTLERPDEGVRLLDEALAAVLR
jgi:pimeloyl-ACP methyl ester carboxylesterase